jgi:hypothetical protein
LTLSKTAIMPRSLPLKPALLFFLATLWRAGFAQPGFVRVDTVQVIRSSVTLKNPWAGGHNFAQFSDIDLNFDGIKDLVVFDRSGVTPYDKLTTYINTGTPNQVSYVHAPRYEKKFPFIHDWMLLVDYNCDGKEDIITYNVGDMCAFKNISSNGNLQFALDVQDIYTTYIGPSYQKLYVAPSDVPALVDVDNDGDIDVLTYEISGSRVEYHRNMSVENYGNCDTLLFVEETGCWGKFTENASNNTLNLNACPIQDPSGTAYRTQPEFPVNGRIEPHPYPLHAGSCLTCLDMDADVDMEALIGDISFCNINLALNGGNPDTADMVSVDPNFPSNTSSVNQILFPCPYHLDVNNDGKRDLLFSPNAPNVSENQSSIIYYQNTAADNAPVFVYQQNDFLQDGMIDVGEGAYPVFFDYDADGLTDLLIGNGYAKLGPGCTGGTNKVSVTAYHNIGTPTSPKYQFATSDYANLQSALAPFRYYVPTFGDMDGDGDEDMIVGDEGGKLHRFRNTAGANNPAVFVQVLPFDMPDNTSNAIDVGQFAAPQLFDIDKDGLLDIVVGERSGKLVYYRNTGTSANPVFTLVSSNLGGVDVMPQCCTGYATPVLFSDSGSTELFVGSEQGYIFHYTNIDNNLGGNFTKLDSLLWKPSEVWEGMRVALTLKDVTNDGVMDMVVGNYRGGLAFYKGDLSAGLGTSYANTASIELFPNPAGASVTLVLTNLDLTDARLEIYDFLGREVMNKKISGITSTVDVQPLSQGVYLCLVKSGNKQAVKKLVIGK